MRIGSLFMNDMKFTMRSYTLLDYLHFVGFHLGKANEIKKRILRL